MLLAEPLPSRGELHWRMLGADFRIHPLFWVSSALMGVYYYQHPVDGGVGVFFAWMLIAFVSILLRELGRVFTARLFGVRGRVYLSGLGGRLLNLEELKRWQRLLVLLMGPLMSFLLYGMAAVLAPLPHVVQEWGGADALGRGLQMFREGNFWWGLLTLLPVWPLDGGQLAAEAAEAIFGRRGLSLTAVLSLLVLAALTVWMEREMSARLLNRFHPFYPLWMEEFAIWTVYCFILWMKGFRLLWSAAEPLDPSAKSERAA